MGRCYKRPEIKVGDMVVPNGRHKYGGLHKWPSNEPRRVSAVRLEDHPTPYWTISVWNPQLDKYSNYDPRNFKVVNPEENGEIGMAQRAVYYAVDFTENKEGYGPESRTIRGPYSTKHEARVDVATIIHEGDKWVIMQTIMLIEGEPPRPPIRITDYITN